MKLIGYSIAVLVAVIIAFGVFVYLELLDKVEEARYEKEQERWYQEWKTKNKETFEAFNKLAAEKGWKLFVACSRGDETFVARLDFPRQCWERLYVSKYRINYANRLSGNWFGLIESQYVRETGESKSYFVLLDGEREAIRIPIEGFLSGINYRTDKMSLKTDNSLIYPGVDKVMRYDLKGKKEEVLVEKPYSCLLSVCEYQGFLYLVIHDKGTGNCEITILQSKSPFNEVLRIPGVSNVMVVGANIILEKDGEILQYDPESYGTTLLLRGFIIRKVSNEAFLYADDLGDGSLRLYNIRTSKSREILRSVPFVRMGGRDIFPFVSPDQEYVFVADFPNVVQKPTPRIDYTWRVYNIESGREVGAFYVPYLDECRIDYVLGWEQ